MHRILEASSAADIRRRSARRPSSAPPSARPLLALDVALGNLGTWWVYLLGPSIGAVIAVWVAYVLRGPGGATEAAN